MPPPLARHVTRNLRTQSTSFAKVLFTFFVRTGNYAVSHSTDTRFSSGKHFLHRISIQIAEYIAKNYKYLQDLHKPTIPDDVMDGIGRYQAYF